jgi:hypothetical protein
MCLARWFGVETTCPYCRQDIEHYDTIPSEETIDNLRQVMVKCKFCKDEVKYECFHDHKNRCQTAKCQACKMKVDIN